MTYIESKKAKGMGSRGAEVIKWMRRVEAGEVSMADVPFELRADKYLAKANSLIHEARLGPDESFRLQMLSEKLYMLALPLNESRRRQIEREAQALGAQIPPDLKAELEGLRDYFFSPELVNTT